MPTLVLRRQGQPDQRSSTGPSAHSKASLNSNKASGRWVRPTSGKHDSSQPSRTPLQELCCGIGLRAGQVPL